MLLQLPPTTPPGPDGPAGVLMAVLLWTGVTVTRAGGELVLDGSLCPVVVVDRLAVAAPEEAPLALDAAVRGARMRRVRCGARPTERR